MGGKNWVPVRSELVFVSVPIGSAVTLVLPKSLQTFESQVSTTPLQLSAAPAHLIPPCYTQQGSVLQTSPRTHPSPSHTLPGHHTEALTGHPGPSGPGGSSLLGLGETRHDFQSSPHIQVAPHGLQGWWQAVPMPTPCLHCREGRQCCSPRSCSLESWLGSWEPGCKAIRATHTVVLRPIAPLSPWAPCA